MLSKIINTVNTVVTFNVIMITIDNCYYSLVFIFSEPLLSKYYYITITAISITIIMRNILILLILQSLSPLISPIWLLLTLILFSLVSISVSISILLLLAYNSQVNSVICAIWLALPSRTRWFSVLVCLFFWGSFFFFLFQLRKKFCFVLFNRRAIQYRKIKEIWH